MHHRDEKFWVYSKLDGKPHNPMAMSVTFTQAKAEYERLGTFYGEDKFLLVKETLTQEIINPNEYRVH